MAARERLRGAYPLLGKDEDVDDTGWVELRGPDQSCVRAHERTYGLSSSRHRLVLCIPYGVCQSLWSAWPWFGPHGPVEPGVIALHVCMLRYVAFMVAGVQPLWATVFDEAHSQYARDPEQIVPRATGCVCMAASMAERLGLPNQLVETAGMEGCCLVSFGDLARAFGSVGE